MDARAEIAALVRMAGSPDELDRYMKRWRPNEESWERLGDAIFVPAVLSDLAGQLMVRGSEARTIKLDAKEKPAFLDLPWEEAIAEFKARGIVKPTELSTLMKDYAQRADKARQLMLQQIQTFVRSELERSLREGGTFKQFADQIEDGSAGLGITADDPRYLNMVFRTNIQSAYGAGRYRAMTDPDVVSERPYVEYRTVGDARVREEHAVLDKTVYAIDTDEWKRIAPPNGYSCRCSMVTLTREEAKGKDIRTTVPDAYVPTTGFDTAPVAKVNAPTPKLPVDDRQKVPATKAIEQHPTVSGEPLQRKPVQAIGPQLKDSNIDYLREGMRSLETHLKGYAGATQPEVQDIAAGRIRTKTGPAFEPIRITTDLHPSLKERGFTHTILDGRHRLEAARRSGATHVLAEIDGKRLLMPIPTIGEPP